MRSIAFVIFVFALGASFAIVQGAGFADAAGFSANVPGGEDVQSQLGSAANDSAAGDSTDLSGDVQNVGGEGNIVSVIISGAQIFARAGGAVVALPSTLASLILPEYASNPIGTFIVVIVGLGLVQAAAGRLWR